MTHAFFKALLFLAAGSVIMGLHHNQDMRWMGGLRKYMPITWITALLGTLALVGMPLFSGYYSKEAIKLSADFSTLPAATFAYYALLAGVFVTSFYSFRLYFMVFHGPERYHLNPDAHHDDHGHHGHDEKPHESPWVVTVPLLLLAVPSVVIGYLTIGPMLFGDFLADAVHVNHVLHPAMTELAAVYHGPLAFALKAFSSIGIYLAIAGALLAWYLYLHNTQLAVERARAQLAEQRAAQDREARQEQSRLMAMLSHEIRTPLAIIDASAQSLQLLLGRDDPACNQRIARIRHGVSRLTTLGSQLLAKDRLDDEGLKLRPAPIDARTLCRDLLVQVDTESRVQIHCDGECTLDAGPALLEVALRNLLVNALRYSPEGSAVPFDIRSGADTMRFRIANTGPGIDPAVRSQLFTTYLRGQHKNPSSGAGLGLYLVKRVVELHGGHIHLSPETEPGVSFTVVLPRHQDGTTPGSSET